MVAEISVLARVMSTSVLPRDHGRAVRGWAYHVINAGDLDLADRLHERDGSNEQKPFTCSELLDAETRPDGLLSLEAGEAVRLRLTTLTTEVLQALDAGFAESGPDFALAVRNFDSQRDRVAQLRIVDLSMPRKLSYAELCDLPGSKQWRLSFLSQTAFSSASGDQLPSGNSGDTAPWLLPIPRLILANLTTKWNEFAPVKDAALRIAGDELERAIHTNLVVSRLRNVRTEPDDGTNLRQRGFLGTVDVQLLEELPGPLFRQFTALMNFAPFAGIGLRVTEGWGQVSVERLRP